MTEAIPLMSGQGVQGRKQLTVRQEVTLWAPATEESEEEDKILFAESKSRTTSLVISDMLILICQLLQVYCLLDAMALRWTWPDNWLFYTRPILLVNLDIWSFVKLSVNGTYKSVQGYHIPSEDMPFPFWVLLVLWAGFMLIALIVYTLVYCTLRAAHHPYMFVKIAQLQRVYIVMLQLLAIPYGTCVAHVFHCNDDGYVDIDNTVRCNRDHHWAYVTPVIVFSLVYYLLFPIWMIIRTRGEMLSMPSDRHEAHLQLKEMEYVHGMDMSWVVGHFHVFGSFKKYGAYYRPCMHWVTFILVLLYALAHNYLDIQAICTAGFIFCVFLGFLIVRPFRVMCFNVALALSWLLLSVDALFGALLSTHSASSIDSVWLLPDYMLRLLAGVTGVWIVILIFFVVFVLVRHCGCCCCCTKRRGCGGGEPLWPMLSTNRIHKLSPHTRKYVKAILRGRMLIDQILKMSPLFSPAHELGRQIHIINAYCREAEILRDPMQNSLWDLLDQLIEVHGQVAPKSLFAESVKDSIRTTAQELMRMMPAFSRRMVQREYDFLLMHPVKRRMLLKMFCIGLFLNQRHEARQRHQLTVPYLQKVWKQKRHATEAEDLPDDGYYEDMYPEQEQTPGDVYPDETLVTMDLMVLDDKEIDDEVVLEEAENWAKDHPIPALNTPYTYTNLVFEDDSDSESMVTDTSSDEEDVQRSHDLGQNTDKRVTFHIKDEISPDRSYDQDTLKERLGDDMEVTDMAELVSGESSKLAPNTQVSSIEQGQGSREWEPVEGTKTQEPDLESTERISGIDTSLMIVEHGNGEPDRAVLSEPQAKSPDHFSQDNEVPAHGDNTGTQFGSRARLIPVAPMAVSESPIGSPTPGKDRQTPTQTDTGQNEEEELADFAI